MISERRARSEDDDEADDSRPRRSPDPERRSRKIRERAEAAEPRTSSKRERTIRDESGEEATAARTYLKGQYLDFLDDVMRCQICGTLKWKTRKDEWYFEAIEVLESEAAHRENRLALCADCAAKYRNADRTDDEKIRHLIANFSTDDEKPSIEIDLADELATITFAPDHARDLKDVLSVWEEKEGLISDKQQELLETPVEECSELSVRVRNALHAEGILTLKDLVQDAGGSDLWDIKNLGEKSIGEIYMFLDSKGLELWDFVGMEFRETENGKLYTVDAEEPEDDQDLD